MGIKNGDIIWWWSGDFHPKTFGYTGRIIELILSTVLPKQEQEEQFCSMNFGMTSWSFLVEKTMTICISILYVHSGLKMEKYFNKNGCTILKKISSLTPFKKLQKMLTSNYIFFAYISPMCMYSTLHYIWCTPRKRHLLRRFISAVCIIFKPHIWLCSLGIIL